MSVHIHALMSCVLVKFDLGILTAIAKKDTISSVIHKVLENKVYLLGGNILGSEV